MRPHTIPFMDSLCLAQFASYFYKEYSNNSETSDAQPELLTHDAIELHVHLDTNTDLSSQLPPRIKLVNSNEVTKYRKIRAVVRYHTHTKKEKSLKTTFTTFLCHITHGLMKILWLEVNKHMHQNSTSLKCKLLLNKIELYLNQIQMLFQKHCTEH